MVPPMMGGTILLRIPRQVGRDTHTLLRHLYRSVDARHRGIMTSSMHKDTKHLRQQIEDSSFSKAAGGGSMTWLMWQGVRTLMWAGSVLRFFLSTGIHFGAQHITAPMPRVKGSKANGHACNSDMSHMLKCECEVVIV